MPGPAPLAASASVQAPSMYPTGPSPSLQTSQQYGVIQGNWPVARPALLPGSHVSGSYGPMILPPGVVPVPGWTPYPVGVADTTCFIGDSFLIICGLVVILENMY